MSEVSKSPTEIVQIARDPRRWPELVGTSETDSVEFHGPIYNLGGEHHKYELAKEIAGLANADGGVLLIGAVTQRAEVSGSDTVAKVEPVPTALIDVRRIEDVLHEWVYPPLGALLTVEVHLEAPSGPRCLVSLTVARPPPLTGPFLVARYPKDGGRSGDVFTSLPGRHNARTRSEPVAAVQGLIRDGIRHRTEAGGGLGLSIGSGPGSSPPTGAKPELSPAVESLALTLAGLSWPGPVFLGATPEPPLDLTDHLVDSKSPLRELLADPPSWRHGGWDLSMGRDVHAVSGDSLAVAAPDWGTLLVTKSGEIGFAFQPRYDAPVKVGDQQRLHRLNGLELAERALLFGELASKVYDKVGARPRTVLFTLRMRKLQEGSDLVGLSRYLPGTFGWQFRDDVRRSQRPEVDARHEARFPFNVETVAYELLKHLYAAFGVEMSDLPYLTAENGKRALSRQGFLEFIRKLQQRT